MADYYALLGLSEDASEEEVRKAYRRLAKQLHPDVNPSKDANARFVLIQQAYEALIDQEKRFKYDQKTKTTTDPFIYYKQKLEALKARREEEDRKRYQEFLKTRDKIKGSKFYYPYKISFYFGALILMVLSILILGSCLFAIVQYHFFMFFFLLPFICGAAFLLRFTILRYRKYRAFFL